MQIEFNNPGYRRDTEDVSNIVFSATVDGEIVYIRVESEALQDIAPNNRFDSPDSQFEANRYYFKEAAESLIRAGEVKNGWVTIKAHHVS